MAYVDRHTLDLSRRVMIATVVTCLVFAALIFRLWYLQIVNGEYFRDRSENNRTRRVFVPPPRGLVLDRNGTILARNRPAFDVELVIEDTPDPRASLRSLADLLKLDAQELLKSVQLLQRKRRRFEPRLILKDVSREVVARVMAHRFELPGIVVSANPAREYVYGDTAAHVIGYIREISRDQLESGRYPGYRAGDRVGQYGLEAKWEYRLQGKAGVQSVIVNAVGTRIGESSFDPEIAGSNLSLTIDLAIQQAAERALGDQRGAVVVMDPNTGELLALLSRPAFDPNVFATEMRLEDWRDLVSGEGRKLSNRAAQGVYPPGSVFKAIMLTAALAEGIVSTSETVFCPGYLTFGSRRFRCHKDEGHGHVDAREAMVQSCDVYFYTIGQRLGIDRIAEYAKRFGLGVPTGLDLVEEAGGTVPSSEWKKRAFRDPEQQKWYPGETLSVAIGQGALTTTPIQVARAISALVNGGHVLQPQIVRGLESSDGLMQQNEFAVKEVGTLGVDAKVLRIVRDAMVGVVNDPTGTGKRAKLDPGYQVTVGGKTGTAQAASLDLSKKGGALKDHAWFASFAPAEKPKVVVVVLVENGGGGGAVAAPIARQVLEAVFADRAPTPSPSPSAEAGHAH